MVVFVFFGAVFRHWIASMSGVVSLAIGTSIQWKWIEPAAVATPRIWWTIAGACFAVAMFQAWHDEYKIRRRREAERNCPRLSLELSAGQPGDRRWMLVNGGADAFNVHSEPMCYGCRYALARADRIARGGSYALIFDIHGKDGTLLATQEETLNHIFRAILDDKSVPDACFEERMRIPVVFRYEDAFRNEFETSCEIYWDLSTNSGGVHHGGVRRVTLAPRWRLLIRTFWGPRTPPTGSVHGS